VLFVAMGMPVKSLAGKKVVAVVLNSDLPRYVNEHRALLKELALVGFDQSKIDIVTQTPNPDPISWSNSIRKVTALGADVVVTFGAPVTLTALRQSADISLVFADVYGPVETSISRSATQGANKVCGMSSKLPMVTLVRTANDIKKFKSMGVLFNAHEVGSVVQLKEIKRLGAQMGFAVKEVNVMSSASLESALRGVLPHIDMLYVSEGTFACQKFDWIVEKASGLKVPVISHMPGAADRGGLLSLEADPFEQGQEAGRQVAGILNGKVRDRLSIKTPKKIYFALNLRTARELNLTVPFQVLSVVTRVIK
jgi:putative ABC transport system substrate-binding protein